MKLKLFTDINPGKLEAKVNDWLEENSWLDIVQITQSTGQLICISIWYKEPNVPILG